MAVRSRLALLALLAAMTTGCQLLPIGEPAIELECVDLPQAECDREGARLLEEARQAGKRIVSIRLTARDGGEVMYDDGTGMVWMP